VRTITITITIYQALTDAIAAVLAMPIGC